MDCSFDAFAGDRPGIGELLGACFPHFEASAIEFEAGQEVVGEGDPTENFYLVTRGLFRAVKYTRDGRRQVFAFYVPGDLCGLEPGGAQANLGGRFLARDIDDPAARPGDRRAGLNQQSRLADARFATDQRR